MKSCGFIFLIMPFCVYGEESFLDYMPNGLIDENSLKIIREAPFTSSANVEESSASMPDIPFGYGIAGQQDISSQQQDSEKDIPPSEKKNESTNDKTITQTAENTPEKLSVQEKKTLTYQPEDTSAPPVYKEPVQVDASLSPVQAKLDSLKSTVLSPSIVSPKENSLPVSDIKNISLQEKKIKIPPRIENVKNEVSPQELAGSQRFLPSGNWQGNTQVFSSENLKRH